MLYLRSEIRMSDELVQYGIVWRIITPLVVLFSNGFLTLKFEKIVIIALIVQPTNDLISKYPSKYLTALYNLMILSASNVNDSLTI